MKQDINQYSDNVTQIRSQNESKVRGSKRKNTKLILKFLKVKILTRQFNYNQN